MKKMTRMAALLMALLMVTASALAAATDTDIPATDTDIVDEPTQAPAATETPAPTTAPAPTRRPSSGSSSNASSTVVPTEEPVVNTKVVLDEANEANGYGGSVLNYLENGSVVLNCTYSAEVLAGFKAWMESITDVEALNNATAFVEFVKNAKALVNAILPELTEEEVAELIVAILNSDIEGVELTEADLAEFFGEGVTGELLGLHTQYGYEFSLLLTEDSILLGARKVAE